MINVRLGTVTRIILADDEKIILPATGFAADCTKNELEWCIRADIGSNQILVKPKEGAVDNNLELRTDKRDYSMQFRVLQTEAKSNKGIEGQAMFRVIFRYPFKAPPLAALMTINAAQNLLTEQANEKNILQERLNISKPNPRNWQYSMQIMKGSNEIAPALVFDDGRFTYFRFPENREIPTVYYVSPNGEESRVNFHIEDDLMVVERLGQRFVLRLGKSVVGIWNEAYDPDGVAPKNGTTIDGVKRIVHQQ